MSMSSTEAAGMRYRIAGHLVAVETVAGQDLERLLPSFAPFRADDTSEAPVLTVQVVPEVETGEQGREVGQFDCGGCVHGVHLMADGGYLFHLRDVDGTVCCVMRSDPDFSLCRVSLPASGGAQCAFGLNNALMMAFAFATASRQTLLMHSSVIRCDGCAYMMTAPSGTGKSTHTRLWYDHIPGCDLMNDDNPVVRVVDGRVMAYGSPWSGKTPCYRNVQAPVGAIVRIRQARENRIRRLGVVESLAALLPAMSNMKWDRRVYSGIHSTVSRVVELCGIYELGCLPDAAAARLCHDTVAV